MGDRNVLTAADGMMLTDGVTYGTEIYLAEGEDAAKYREISEAEYETILEVEANKQSE